MNIPFDLTPADIGCITEAFEALAGSATGDLGVYAPVVMARDPEWNAQALDLLERIDAARPGGLTYDREQAQDPDCLWYLPPAGRCRIRADHPPSADWCPLGRSA